MPYRALKQPRRLILAWSLTLAIYLFTAFYIIVFSLAPCDPPTLHNVTTLVNTSNATAAYGLAPPAPPAPPAPLVTRMRRVLSHELSSDADSDSDKACFQEPGCLSWSRTERSPYGGV